MAERDILPVSSGIGMELIRLVDIALCMGFSPSLLFMTVHSLLISQLRLLLHADESLCTANSASLLPENKDSMNLETCPLILKM